MSRKKRSRGSKDDFGMFKKAAVGIATIGVATGVAGGIAGRAGAPAGVTQGLSTAAGFVPVATTAALGFGTLGIVKKQLKPHTKKKIGGIY